MPKLLRFVFLAAVAMPSAFSQFDRVRDAPLKDFQSYFNQIAQGVESERRDAVMKAIKEMNERPLPAFSAMLNDIPSKLEAVPIIVSKAKVVLEQLNNFRQSLNSLQGALPQLDNSNYKNEFSRLKDAKERLMQALSDALQTTNEVSKSLRLACTGCPM